MEEILGSRGKIKIIKIIYENGEINITRITKISGLNHKLVTKHLQELKNRGIIVEKVIGRVKFYSINFKNPASLALVDVLSLIEKEA